MVFYSVVLLLKPISRTNTSQALREITNVIYTNNGLIRKFKNEGIIKPYQLFRDVDNSVISSVRYITMDLDLGEAEMAKVEKTIREHGDVQMLLKLNNLENPIGLKNNKFKNAADANPEMQDYHFPLDTFTRLEEEINWPPQVSGDVYDQLDKNWKEFSRTRWSNYLRN